MQLNEEDANRLSLTSFWGLFLISGIACFIALTVFFLRLCCQYRKFVPAGEEEGEVEEIQSVPPRRAIRQTNSFKDLMDFVDRKEAEIKHMLKRKSGDKNHASPSSDVQSNSVP